MYIYFQFGFEISCSTIEETDNLTINKKLIH